MARAQNSNKGRFNKQVIEVSASGSLYFGSFSTNTAILSANSTGLKINGKTTAVITGNSTGIVLVGGIKISNKANAVITGNATGIVLNAAVKVSNQKYISANSTGFIFTTSAAKPSTRSSSKIVFITNSTGKNTIAVNTTGTTWKYLYLTGALNSTSGY